MTEIKKIEIDYKLLQKICSYYEIPIAIFLGNLNCFPKANITRNKIILKKVDLFDEIYNIIQYDFMEFMNEKTPETENKGDE